MKSTTLSYALQNADGVKIVGQNVANWYAMLPNHPTDCAQFHTDEEEIIEALDQPIEVDAQGHATFKDLDGKEMTLILTQISPWQPGEG